MNDLILKTENLTKRYGKRLAVDHINLEVFRGDVFGFLGPNGAGKSTTIRMLLSLIEPTDGTVYLFGSNVRKDREVLGRVGGLVERPDFYNYLSGKRNLEIVGALYGKVDGKRILEVLDLVGLQGRENDRVKSYSHGMKQRLGIAQALLVEPEFLILDEPTNGLDPQGMKEIRELIHALANEKGMTIFLSSHLLHEVEQVATRMAIIHKGELVTQGKVIELLNREAISVQIFIDRKEEAIARLASFSWVSDVRDSSDYLMCLMPESKLAETNTLLVRDGFAVQGFIPRRSLEDYFLSITETADKANGK